ncbi:MULTISPECIES: helicase-associated domain-containing protein [unclassified Leptolyngbya]|uniref:helicase-associated domain-containing protein n=1 Tax=unclassified Leptolyngbya TaxID=2650499 RepID=UPI001685D91F|nr:MULTISPECIES: helicase-associated domain-containing protein [unclassified Leptolyngbya]MBD1913153.1 helicase-associated domain-containing protein [Leptolyngbya sp. FACHB-8]MBD2158808.1 helicase-associated domain-containing protein [Leptolyngbya sp. FACHB-16]
MPYYSQPEQIPTLLEALNNCTVDQLKVLAQLLPSGTIPTRKAELVSYVSQRLQGKALQRLWQQCDRLQQATIAEVVHSRNDRYQQQRFVSKYGAEAKWQQDDRPSYYSFRPTILGLFFYSGTMPKDLKAQLKAFVPPPEPTQMDSLETLPSSLPRTLMTYDNRERKQYKTTVEFPLTVRETEAIARRDVQTVLRLVDLGKVAVSDKTFFPTGATLNMIAEVLEDGDYYSGWAAKRSPAGWDYEYDIGSIKPFAWTMLLQAGKLVELNGKRLALTKAGQKALNEPSEKTLQTLWKQWLKTTFLDELRRIDSIKGQTGKAKRSLTAVAGRRNVIVSALKDCAIDRWVEFSAFLRYMVAAGYDFQVSRNPESLSLEDYGSFYYNSWMLLEARYILCFLFEYVATLGLIDVAYLHPDEGFLILPMDHYHEATFSRYDGLAYFRLTPLGAYLLGLSDRYQPAAPTPKRILRVLPNLEVVAVSELSRADRLLLNSFLVSVSDVVWKLDQAKLLDAIAQGRTVKELQDWLMASSGEPLPQPVTQFLADLQTRTTSLQDLGAARLIRCADAALAAQIASDSRTKAYCFLADQPKAIGTGGACYLVVPAETETKFRNGLKKMGYSLPGLG